MKSFCQALSLLLLTLVATPSFSQTESSPPTQTAPPSGTDLDAAARYFEANFPATYDIIWSSPTPDFVKSSQVEIATILIKTLGHPSVAETLANRLQVEFPTLLANALSSTSEEWLRQGNVLAANVGQAVAEGLAVKAGAALATDLLFQTPPMRNTHPQLEGPLRIVVETTIVEMYDAQKALHDPSALLGKFLDRYHEIIEIYNATLLVASTQKQALAAAVLANETAAIAAAEIGGERGDEIIRRAIEYLEIAPISQAVGTDDGEAVDGVLLMGLQALYAYHRGDEVLARQQAEIVRQLGTDGANIQPFSAITKPLDWAVTVINMGKDSPEIAAELFLGTTALANLFDLPSADTGPPPPSEILRSSLADAEVYGEYEKVFSEAKVNAIVDSVDPTLSGAVAEKFAWAASEVFLADVRARNSFLNITYDEAMAFASGLEREERARILILSVLDQVATKHGLSINDFQLLNDGRNVNQSETLSFIPELADIDGKAGWELRPTYESVFHAYGYDPSDVRKYTHAAGCEYVFRRVDDGWQFVNDGVNTGTFNYSNRIVAHTLLDIFPWILWGVGAEEKRTFQERLTLAQENGAASQIAARLQNALNEREADQPTSVSAEECGSRPGEPNVVWASGEPEPSNVPIDPNALFVEAVATYRDALVKSGEEQAAAFEEVRDSFDEIVEYFPETRQAQAILTEAVPGIDFSLLVDPSVENTDSGFEIGLETGLYAIDPALCSVESTVGDSWGTLFQKISGTQVQRGTERDCDIQTVEMEGDIVSASAECSVEGTSEIESWKWRKSSPSSFAETEGRHAGKAYYRCTPAGASEASSMSATNQVSTQTNAQDSPTVDFVYVQTHSRQDFQDAFEVAQELSRNGAPHVNVFASANGWFAITAVRVPTTEASEAKLQEVITTFDLPNDSLFTVGENFVQLQASFEDHSTRPDDQLFIATDQLRGGWETADGWLLVFEGSAATVARGGDANRPVGSEILRVRALVDGQLEANWRYKDGVWREISGTFDTTQMLLQDRSNRWTLRRTSEGVPNSDATRSASTVPDLEGHWHFAETQHITFQIADGAGLVTSDASGDRYAKNFASSYPMGTEILRITSVEDSRFTGSWLYYDGKWRDITGVTSTDRIDFSGEGNAAWSWLRADQEAAQKKLETSIRPANFEDWQDDTAQRALADIRSMPVAVVDDACGEVRGPLNRNQMMALFNRRWLDYEFDGRTEYSQVVQNDHIYDDSLRFPSIETSAYRVFMCTRGAFPFVASRSRVEQKWFRIRINGAKPAPRVAMGEGRAFREAHARAAAPIQISNIAGCSTTSQGINGVGEVRWSGECRNGLPVGEGVVQWWDTNGNLAWKTFVGERYWTRFDDRLFTGRVVVELDLSQVFLELTGCTDGGSAVRVDLPSTVAKEIFTAIGVVNWLRDDAEKFSGEHCPGRPLNQLSVYRGNQSEPDFLWNFSWDLNRTSLISQYSSEFLREGRDIKTSERRALIESRAEARKDTYERDRQAIQSAARSFLDTGKGTLANIIAALEIDEIATLELLESGVRIELEPTDNMSSTQSDGQQQYRVAYTVISPFEQLERQLKMDLANMNYTSSLNLLFDMSANPIPRRLNFTCTYPNLRNVPKSRESVRAEMVSYSSGRDGYRVSMSCSS